MNATPDPICVLVADDEAPMRMRLRSLLAEDPEVGRVIEAESGIAAVELTTKERPDIIFLDVQMPGLDGFQVINAVGAENMPLTVFITAFDRFALQAFEADALDYLLKPFGNRRYETMMARAKKRLRESRAGGSSAGDPFGPELLKLAADRSQPEPASEWLAVRDRDTTRLVSIHDIDWIEASGTYVTLHAGDEEFLHRVALATLGKRLDPAQFVRTHRSAIVKLKSIALLERRSHGEFDIVLKSGTRLMLSRKYKPQLEKLLGQTL